MGIVWSALRRIFSRQETRRSREDTVSLVQNESPAPTNYGTITETANQGTNDSSSKDDITENAKEDRSALPDSTSTTVTGTINQRHIQSANTADTGTTNKVTSQRLAVQGNLQGNLVGPANISGNNNCISINTPAATIDTMRREPLEFDVQDKVPNFIGREKSIEAIHCFLNPKGNVTPSIYSRTVLICGIAGVGKTQLVRKYIHQHKESYFYVLWINAEKQLETTGRLRKLATKLKIDICKNGEPAEEIVNQDILDTIFDYVCQRRTLIVFDNVESSITDGGEQELDCLLPRTIKTGWKSPAIIVTTRNSDWQHFMHFIHLPVFEAKETLELLSTLGIRNIDDNQDSIQKIRQMCQDLPIGLQQVISCFQKKRKEHVSCSNEPYTLKEFLAEVLCSETELLLSAKHKEHLKFFELMENIFKHVATMEHGTVALHCLQIMAYLKPDNIPVEILTPLLSNYENLGKTPALLRDFNLATLYNGCYQIHRMIQAAVIQSTFIKDLPVKYNLLEELVNVFFKLLEVIGTFTREMTHEILESAVRLNSQLPQVNLALSDKCREATPTYNNVYWQQVLYGEDTEEISTLVEEPSESTVGTNHEATIISETNLAQPFNENDNHRERRLYSTVVRRTFTFHY